MRIEMFVFKNLYLECTGQIIFDDHTPEAFAKGQERRLLTGKPEEVFPFENTLLYHLGSYDDETMKFEPKESPVLILKCNEVLESRKLKEAMMKKAQESEVSENGKN